MHSPIERPHFPKHKPPRLSRHQNQDYPDRAIHLLHNIEAIARQWQDELDKIHHQITQLYNQGPIVEGWLESTPNLTPNSAHASARTTYRLCKLNENGEVSSRPCLPEEVASISLALHRYQQLRQFLNQKHILEERLFQLAQSLNSLHSQLGDGEMGG